MAMILTSFSGGLSASTCWRRASWPSFSLEKPASQNDSPSWVPGQNRLGRHKVGNHSLSESYHRGYQALSPRLHQHDRPLATLMDRRMALVPKAFRNECPVDTEFGRLYVPGEDEWRRPDRPMAFNARTGKWEDPLCNRCGECETCFKRYPRESWAAAQKEREAARRERDAATGQPRAPYALMHNGEPWWF
jgi:hypothetical protein